MTIDAHHHLWKYSATEYGWIAPDQRAIRRDTCQKIWNR